MNRFSNLLTERIIRPRNGGTLTPSQGMRLVIGKERGLTVYILVDESDGVIADAKFTCSLGPAIVGAADVAVEMILRKNYLQANRISSEMIDHKVRDFAHIPAFSHDSFNEVISAIDEALLKCHDIAIESPVQVKEETSAHPGWELLSKEEKLDVIKKVITEDIQPYIELDAGGIEIVSFRENLLTIEYQGACTTCPSAIGGTLDAITNILRSKVHPSLIVQPTALQFQ